MQRALTLAAKGKGWVSPNPFVGCVIVKKGKSVGEAYHAHYGGPHAEAIALKKAGRRAQGATLYVNLEPCSHWGKTPPCAPQIVKSGIKKVYAAIPDPNPRVSGRGLRLLKKKGIYVHVGLLKESAAFLNRSFLTSMKRPRPYVILKSAMTLDGKIATRTGNSKWITGPLARKRGYQLRAEADAVLIGATTAQKDNPSLTSHGLGKNPLRVILDPTLRTSPSLKVYNVKEARTLLITSKHAPKAKIIRFLKVGVEIAQVQEISGQLNIKFILYYLRKINVYQLLVEGGGTTAWPFLKHGFVDEMYTFLAPKLVGGKDAITTIEGQGMGKISQSFEFRKVFIEKIGNDVLIKAIR